ncbi:MAG: hypothetical protein KAJ09_08135 [Deltaproteobacteria bacterium]|nr:hypothetical protein [Deltaproteobacteria bacterium]
MKHYFRQIAPALDLVEARKALWRSVDGFGKEGSRKKEKGIERAILSAGECRW